jgi:hypothetical protein
MRNAALFPANIFAVGLAIGLAACTPPQESGVKVIVGAKLIAAPGAAPIDYSIVIVEGAKFREVGPQRSTPVPKGAEMTRGIGMIIEPAPGGAPIAAGQPADLILKSETDSTGRVMHNGEWVR